MQITADDIHWAKCIIAPVYRKARFLRSDMESEAVIALWQFSEKYDPTINDNFRKAATTRVMGAALDVIRKYNPTHRKTYKGEKIFFSQDSTRSNKFEEDGELYESESSAVNDWVEQDYESKQLEQIHEAIEKLPVRFKKCFQLYIQEIPAVQIAKILGLSEKYVWVLLCNGRKELKNLIKG